MRMSGVSVPLLTFQIPPSPPPAVAEAWAEFNRVANRYRDASDDLKDAQQALVGAKAADVRAIVEATGAGKEPNDPQANERKAQAEIERLETLKRGLREASDQAGNVLAEKIAAHQYEWVADLDKQTTRLADAFDEAVAVAKRALEAYLPSRAGTNWVRNFDPKLAIGGTYSQFAGGRLRLNGKHLGMPELRGEHDPSHLLALAAHATDPQPAPRPEPPSRRHPKVTADV